MKLINKIFRTQEGQELQLINSETEKESCKNYLMVKDGNIDVAIGDQKVEMPEILINELGITYKYVKNLKEYIKELAQKQGVYFAIEKAPIRVWDNHHQEEEPICSKTDGCVKHYVHLTEDDVPVQSTTTLKFYALSKKILEENYLQDQAQLKNEHKIYRPKPGIVTQWVRTYENIVTLINGELKFMNTPMINVTNPDEISSCDQIEWWGDECIWPRYKPVGFYSTPREEYDEYEPIQRTFVIPPILL